MKESTHLKNMGNGRVFLYSANLATRNDMIPCNAQGEVLTGHVGDAESIDATQERRVTKFLGNTVNGVLYPYTEFLAERGDMISIDTKAQWEAMRQTGEAPEQDSGAVAPTLQRSANAPPIEAPKEPEIPMPVINTGIQLPGIEGMGAREAKTTLSDWAEKNFKVKIDRRPALIDVVKECELLAMKSMDTAQAG